LQAGNFLQSTLGKSTLTLCQLGQMIIGLQCRQAAIAPSRSTLMNRSHFSCLFAALLGAALASPALAAPGPTSTLYITNYLELGDGTVTGLDLVQGVNETSNPTSFPLGIDIAVYGDVRTMGYSQNDQGERFDLAGSFAVGGPYTNNIAGSQLHDGTSDGNYNYSVN
jgi:hypothetical protein